MKKLLIDLPEKIETSRLILQMPKAGFGKKLHEAIMDGYDDYVKWLNWPQTPATVEDVEEECRKHHAEFILRDFVRYIIIKKNSQRVIGRCAFPPTRTNWLVPKFCIAYFIRKNNRSQGYATEAAHAMAMLAFQKLKAKKVEIFCDSANLCSQRVPLKLGFLLEYTAKGMWPRYDGKLVNAQCYALFSQKKLIFTD